MSVDQLLDRYDRGRLSRRELLTALALLGVASDPARLLAITAMDFSGGPPTLNCVRIAEEDTQTGSPGQKGDS